MIVQTPREATLVERTAVYVSEKLGHTNVADCRGLSRISKLNTLSYQVWVKNVVLERIVVTHSGQFENFERHCKGSPGAQVLL